MGSFNHSKLALSSNVFIHVYSRVSHTTPLNVPRQTWGSVQDESLRSSKGFTWVEPVLLSAGNAEIRCRLPLSQDSQETSGVMEGRRRKYLTKGA